MATPGSGPSEALSAGATGALTVKCGEVPVTHLSPDDAVELVLGWAIANRGDAAQGRSVHLVNAWTVVLADRDPHLAQLLADATLNLPDGTPLVWNARRRGHDAPAERVRGQQFFIDALDRGREHDAAHYFLGSTPETLELLTAEVTSRFPGVRVVGTDSPPFRQMSEREIALQDRRIVDSGAEIVWVGLGTPKQDVETERLARSLPVVAAAVGAAFDFTAGTVPTAPDWMRGHGLEWAHRFASEPRRLWRRYLIGNAQFLRIAARSPAS